MVGGAVVVGTAVVAGTTVVVVVVEVDVLAVVDVDVVEVVVVDVDDVEVGGGIVVTATAPGAAPPAPVSAPTVAMPEDAANTATTSAHAPTNGTAA